MDEKTKLVLALQQVHNLTELLNGNEYEQFINSHLISIQVELQRQLTNLTHSPTIKK
jgi:hypothetical protein